MVSFLQRFGLSLALLAPVLALCQDVAVYDYRVEQQYPHDTNAFTQGLFLRDGVLFESTGGYGSSTLREVEKATGKVLRRQQLPSRFFGEGIVDWGDRIIWVMWRARKGFVYDRNTFEQLASFDLPGQGWGLTKSATQLVLSDGTDVISFLSPDSFEVERRIRVRFRGQPLGNLNELEWVGDAIYANVWQTDYVARIDPESGQVTAMIDLTGLLPKELRVPGHTDVLNGIAYDETSKRFLVTGKNWPRLFEISLIPRLNKR
ncbi:MAG: glutaminyl-peptide cyclotransferase [Pseudomonadota bacterium]